MSSPLAITGIGLTTSLGRGAAENWKRLVAAESGIGPVHSFDVGDSDVRDAGEDPPWEASAHDAPDTSPELRFLLDACGEALEHACLRSSPAGGPPTPKAGLETWPGPTAGLTPATDSGPPVRPLFSSADGFKAPP